MLRRFERGATRNENRFSKSKRWHFEDIFKFIQDQEWDKVAKILKIDAGSACRLVDKTGLTPLAVSVASYAPVELIRTMIEAYPDAVLISDGNGATPLHLACLNGTTPSIVVLLLEGHESQIETMVDNHNYTVLHHAVEYVCLLIENRYSYKETENSQITYSIASEHDDYLEIVKILCKAGPGMVHRCTTDSGDTPLDIPQVILCRIITKSSRHEHEILARRLLEVYHVLKETSIKYYIIQKKNWESSGFIEQKHIANCEHSLPSADSTLGSSNFTVISTNSSKSRLF